MRSDKDVGNPPGRARHWSLRSNDAELARLFACCMVLAIGGGAQESSLIASQILVGSEHQECDGLVPVEGRAERTERGRDTLVVAGAIQGLITMSGMRNTPKPLPKGGGWGFAFGSLPGDKAGGGGGGEGGARGRGGGRGRYERLGEGSEMMKGIKSAATALLLEVMHPSFHTLHPTTYTLHPTSYTLHPAPYALHPTPYTLHPTPYTLHPAQYFVLPHIGPLSCF